MQFFDDSLLPETQDPLVIQVAPYAPSFLPRDSDDIPVSFAQQVQKAVDGLYSGNKQLLEGVIRDDDLINRMEIEIDALCNQIIAKRQPTAIDLRMIVSVLKAISDIERVGDKARKIARLGISISSQSGAPLNVELKPAPGDARRTGAVVAAQIAREWAGVLPPLLTSFETAALKAAAEAAPNLPRGLLLECFAAGWRETAQRLGCVAVVAEQGAWTAETAAAARSAGLRMLAYTVNDDAQAARLLALGLDGVITDRVDHFRA